MFHLGYGLKPVDAVILQFPIQRRVSSLVRILPPFEPWPFLARQWLVCMSGSNGSKIQLPKLCSFLWNATWQNEWHAVVVFGDAVGNLCLSPIATASWIDIGRGV